MPHIRQQLRDAFKARLSGIRGVRTICSARPWNFGEEELPAIQVVTPTEQIEPICPSEIETDRIVDVDVLLHMLGNECMDDEADDIAVDIETLIMTATGGIWDNGVILHFPSSAEFALDDEVGERTLAVLRTRFRVRIHATNPETIGD